MPTSPTPRSTGPRYIEATSSSAYQFSICTLMTRPSQYQDMISSYRAAGFNERCEYLCIDNSSGNVFDAYSGYNRFLLEASGDYIILTHQDVEIAFDDRVILEDRLRELSMVDPDWGACGNAGGVSYGRNAIRISDPHQENVRLGPFPQVIVSLDENFIVVRRAANLRLSNDIQGYHMYGADLCLMADLAGHRCYVIDFHLRHLSKGTMDSSFHDAVAQFSDKYGHAFRSRWIQTSATSVFLSSIPLLRRIATAKMTRALGLACRFGS